MSILNEGRKEKMGRETFYEKRNGRFGFGKKGMREVLVIVTSFFLLISMVRWSFDVGIKPAFAEAPPVEWEKTYGGPDYDSACSVVQTGDGGYAIIGSTNSFGAGGYDFWLVKTDSYGNMQWNRTYGGAGWDQTGSMIQTSDGGYAIVGWTDSYGAGLADFWFVKTDSNGNMLWSQTYGGTNEDRGASIVQTADGGYALVGFTNSFGAGSLDFWLVKIDSNGNMHWNKTYGGVGMDLAFSIVQAFDRGYTITGWTDSFGAGGADFWLVKTDSNGSIVWNQTYGGANSDVASSVIQTAEGGYAVTGWTDSFGAGGSDFWLIKLAGEGYQGWVTKAPLPELLEGAAGAVVEGKIYVLKGHNPEVGDTGDVRIYDPANDSWSYGTPSPIADAEFYQAGMVSGKIYVIGGRNTFDGNEEYDPLMDTWTAKAPMPTGRAGHALAVVDNIIYVIGGRDGGAPLSGSVTNVVEAYDPATDSWFTGLAPMPTPRSDMTAAVVNGKIYVIGGWDGTNILDIVEIYDPLTDTWFFGSPMPTPRADLGAVERLGYIHAIGGVNATGAQISTHEVYDPSNDTWSIAEPMPTPRAELVVVNLDEVIYAIGGGFLGESADVNEAYYGPAEIHDVAVVNVTSSKTVVGKGYSTSVNVTVENQGYFTETFNVTLYAQLQETIANETYAILTDDFNDNILDTSKWTILSGGGTSSINETNQRIEISTDGSNRVYLKTAQSIYSTPSIIEVDTLFPSGSSYSWSQVVIRWDGQITGTYDEPTNGIWISLCLDDNNIVIAKFVNGTGTTLNQTSYTPLTDVWYHIKIVDNGEKIKVYINGTIILQASDTFSGGNYAGLFSREFTNTVYFDNFLMQTSLEMGLVGYWKLDEGAGTIAYDSSGYDNDGTIYGAIWVNGKHGKALSFDGEDDYVEVPDSPTLDIENEITIAAWIKINSLPGSYAAHLVGKAYESDDWDGNYWIALGPNGEWSFSFAPAGQSAIDHWSTGTLETNKWYHIAATFNDANDIVKLYVNDTLDSQFVETNSMVTDDFPLLMAKGGLWYFNGILDEVRIYNRALSEEEIRTLAGLYPPIPVQTQTVTLESGASTTITFTWNTTNFDYGNYTIFAVADTLPDETDTTDNTYVDGTVLVTIPGDINGDLHVNNEDLFLLASVYGSKVSDPHYYPEADIDNDGNIDLIDLFIHARNYGKTV
jgi:hypothetical protein